MLGAVGRGGGLLFNEYRVSVLHGEKRSRTGGDGDMVTCVYLTPHKMVKMVNFMVRIILSHKNKNEWTRRFLSVSELETEAPTPIPGSK